MLGEALTVDDDVRLCGNQCFQVRFAVHTQVGLDRVFIDLVREGIWDNAERGSHDIEVPIREDFEGAVIRYRDALERYVQLMGAVIIFDLQCAFRCPLVRTLVLFFRSATCGKRQGGDSHDRQKSAMNFLHCAFLIDEKQMPH